jgi:hypothetical protein
MGKSTGTGQSKKSGRAGRLRADQPGKVRRDSSAEKVQPGQLRLNKTGGTSQ